MSVDESVTYVNMFQEVCRREAMRKKKDEQK